VNEGIFVLGLVLSVVAACVSYWIKTRIFPGPTGPLHRCPACHKFAAPGSGPSDARYSEGMLSQLCRDCGHEWKRPAHNRVAEKYEEPLDGGSYREPPKRGAA